VRCEVITTVLIRISGMLHHVSRKKITDNSEEHSMSISGSSSPLFFNCLKLKKVALCSSETSVTIYQSTLGNIPEDLILHQNCHENLISLLSKKKIVKKSHSFEAVVGRSKSCMKN